MPIVKSQEESESATKPLWVQCCRGGKDSQGNIIPTVHLKDERVCQIKMIQGLYENRPRLVKDQVEAVARAKQQQRRLESQGQGLRLGSNSHQVFFWRLLHLFFASEAQMIGD